MGKVYDEIDDKLADWLIAQPVFVIATAPISGDGLINASPKGGSGTFAVLDEHSVAYLDLTGSGIETIAHIRENGRIILMFMAFEGRPNIVRLHGHGRVVLPGTDDYTHLAPRFSEHPGARAIIVVDVTRISDSCGFAVPLMDFVAERDVLDKSNGRKSDDELKTYRAVKNSVSVDGLPGLAS